MLKIAMTLNANCLAIRFDTVIVATSLVSVASSNQAGMKLFRLARVFRIFRMLRTVQSLNKLVIALQQSLPAVANAFLLVLLVCCLYSILAARIFGTVDPNFACFGTSMFTFWMLMTFDNACGIIQGVMSTYDSALEIAGIAVYFISFQLLVGYILVNIIMAVLLDEFTDSSCQARAEQLALESSRSMRGAGPFDPLLARLSALERRDAVEDELQALFETIDEDESGSVDVRELQLGLSREGLLPAAYVEDLDDFASLVEARGVQLKRRMSFGSFRRLVLAELDRYELRAIDRALVDERINDKVNTALKALREVLAASRRLRPVEQRLAALAPRVAALESGSSSKSSKQFCSDSLQPGPGYGDPDGPPIGRAPSPSRACAIPRIVDSGQKRQFGSESAECPNASISLGWQSSQCPPSSGRRRGPATTPRAAAPQRHGAALDSESPRRRGTGGEAESPRLGRERCSSAGWTQPRGSGGGGGTSGGGGGRKGTATAKGSEVLVVDSNGNGSGPARSARLEGSYDPRGRWWTGASKGHGEGTADVSPIPGESVSEDGGNDSSGARRAERAANELPEMLARPTWRARARVSAVGAGLNGADSVQPAGGGVRLLLPLPKSQRRRSTAAARKAAAEARDCNSEGGQLIAGPGTQKEARAVGSS